MKYLYKTTGVVVESGIKLDSSLFIPVQEDSDQADAAITKEKRTTKRQTKPKACEE